jgi:hypothetical protein
MNWLGKVFVVLILIMSLVFMGLAMAVYATHRNWREVVEGPNGLRAQLDQARQANEELKSEHNRRVENLSREKEAAEQQLAKLETERVALADRNVQIQTELDQLKQQQREHIAAVASTQSLNEGLTKEATGLRQQIRSEQQARDAAFAKTLEATETVHQLTGQYENQRERYEQLTKQAAGMRHVMREEGLDPDTEPGAVVPTVDGVVSQVRRTAGAQLVEVTIGADDGLKAGNTLEVFRGSKYLGRVEVLQTSPDKSVGRVDRRFQQGQIVEGDRVATRLKL